MDAYLATGEMVIMAAWLAGLAAPNPVGMRQGMARRTQGALALEEWGAQGRTGVADPPGVCRVRRPTVVAGVLCLVGQDEAMGVLVRRWEQRQEGRGQVVLGMRQEPRAWRGRRQVALGGSGGGVPEQTPV